MEPQIPAPRPSAEMGPVRQGGELPRPYTAGGESLPSPTPEQSPRVETRENQPLPPSGAPTPAPATPLAPVQSAPSKTADDAASTTHLNPATAADDDVIEKAWVDRAKKIVAETTDNPYLQKQKVSELRADYQLKRYGRDVKVPTD